MIHNFGFPQNDRIPKLATVFTGLSPGTSYIARISTETRDFNGEAVRSEPISHPLQTIGVFTHCYDSFMTHLFQENVVLPVDERTLAVEQMSNVICLILTKPKLDLHDSYRVSIKKKDSDVTIAMRKIQDLGQFGGEKRVSHH